MSPSGELLDPVALRRQIAERFPIPAVAQCDNLLREALTFVLGEALVAGPLAPLPIIAQVGSRLTCEGGADVPTTWTTAPT